MKRKLIACITVFASVCLILLFVRYCTSINDVWNTKANRVMKIQTQYLSLEFPMEYKNSLRHEEHVGTELTEEVFYMVQGDKSTELFRLCFGNETAGNLVGYLHTDTGIVPVTIQLKGSPDNMDEDTENLYFGMMQGVNTVLECVYNDARFSEYSDFHPGEEKTAKMKYWTVKLPEGITWEEITEDNVYRADFYGEVSSKRIKLYSISIGDQKLDNTMGIMKIDGKDYFVSVNIEGIAQTVTLPETEQNIVYSMIDTVNDVIKEITSSKNYSEFTEE